MKLIDVFPLLTKNVLKSVQLLINVLYLHVESHKNI